MNHEEQKLQIECVAWFRAQYPHYAMLLTHPINEGGRNTGRIGGIHKAEGTQAGVPDLLLFMPAEYHERVPNDEWLFNYVSYAGLGIEFKTVKGKQSKEQKEFQKMFEAACYKYIVVRDFDGFRREVNDYIAHVKETVRRVVAATHVEIAQAAEEREKEKFYKIIRKKK